MNPAVLADIVPFLPDVLKRIPWQVRAALLALLAVAGIYVLAALVFGLPLSAELLKIVGAVAVPAGVPALANINLGKETPEEAFQRGWAVAQEIIAEEKSVAPASFVDEVAKEVEPVAAAVESAVSAVEAAAPVVAQVVDAVAPAAAPVVAEVANVVNQVTAPAPTVPLAA